MELTKITVLLSTLLVFLLGAVSVSAKDKLTAGSRWVVTGTITVKPRKATTYFQDGKQINSPMSGDKYYPWCAIQSGEKAKQQMTITKGTFEITSVSYFSDAVNETLSSYKTIMNVKSADHPNVNKFICGNWDDNTGTYLSIEQMRTTMKGMFDLQLAP